jgi:large subunit ribosomal protein L7/L12
MWNPEIVELGDRITGLSKLKARELGEDLEVVYGIQASPPTATAPEDQPVIKPDLEPTAFSVRVDRIDEARRIALIRLIRELLGLGLKESRDLVASLPIVIKKDLPRQQAEELKARLDVSDRAVSAFLSHTARLLGPLTDRAGKDGAICWFASFIYLEQPFL